MQAQSFSRKQKIPETLRVRKEPWYKEETHTDLVCLDLPKTHRKQLMLKQVFTQTYNHTHTSKDFKRDRFRKKEVTRF